MVKRLTIFGGIIIILIVLSQILLPMAVSQGIERAVRTLAHVRDVTVEAENFPAVGMLAGRFDRIALTAQAVQTDDIAFERLEMNLAGAELDTAAFLEGVLRVRSVRDAEVRAVISEAALADLINRKVKGAKDAKVRITPEKVTAQSTLSLGKMVRAGVVLEGNIIVSDNRIVFATEHFKIDNPMLGKLGGTVFTDLVLVDFQELPLAVQVKDVAQMEGEVVISADNRP